MQMQEAAGPYGNCHRCGAAMAPVMIGGGTMILCTKCTSKEDQDAQERFTEQVKRFLGQ